MELGSSSAAAWRSCCLAQLQQPAEQGSLHSGTGQRQAEQRRQLLLRLWSAGVSVEPARVREHLLLHERRPNVVQRAQRAAGSRVKRWSAVRAIQLRVQQTIA